jgi:hypothetical protein
MIRMSTYLRQYKCVFTLGRSHDEDILTILAGLATSWTSRQTVLFRRGKANPHPRPARELQGISLPSFELTRGNMEMRDLD